MTREEAINDIRRRTCKGSHSKPNECQWKEEGFGTCEECGFGLAIKALEQEPVLDKIIAEIDSLERFEIRGEKTPLINGDNVLQIIDKYRAEGSDKE